MNAAPTPYLHIFKIYSVTRPADLAELGESYELEPATDNAGLYSHTGATVDPPLEESGLKRQETTGFEVSGASPVPSDSEEDVTSVTDGINGMKLTVATQETSGAQRGPEEFDMPEEPDEFYVEYDPDVLVSHLPELGGEPFNIVCQNQKAWFRIDKDKALKYGVPEDKIRVVKGAYKLVDMEPYQRTGGLTDEEVQAYQREVCFTSTDVLRHVSVQFGHASLKVNQSNFLLTSWLKSHKRSNPWYQTKSKKPDPVPDPVLSKTATDEELHEYRKQVELYKEYEEKLARYEALEKWHEEYRASLTRESLMLSFWPDWLDNILTEDHPLFLEKGVWGESYSLTVKRHGVEAINLKAEIQTSRILQSLTHTTYPGGEPQKKRYSHAIEPALVLPFHVIAGEVGTALNEYTYTPLARPMYEPTNSELAMHVYHVRYRPELDRDYKIKLENHPTISAVVYDFYSDSDSGASPMNKPPRLTYWVGEGGEFDGRLLGRRILYPAQAKKTIGCNAGSVICHFEYPVYRGLEYRLVVSLPEEPQKEQEKVKVRQPDDAASKERTSRRSQTPPQVGATGDARQERLSTWMNYFLSKQSTPGYVQQIEHELEELASAYIMSAFYDFVSSVALDAIGVKYQSPIPRFPKILVFRALQHMGVIH